MRKPPDQQVNAGHCLGPGCHQEDSLQQVHISYPWAEVLSKTGTLPSTFHRQHFALMVTNSLRDWSDHPISCHKIVIVACMVSTHPWDAGWHCPVSLGEFNFHAYLGFRQLRPIDTQMGWDKGCFPWRLLDLVSPPAQQASCCLTLGDCSMAHLAWRHLLHRGGG